MMYFTIVIIICPVDFCVAAVLRPEPSRSDMITRTWPASSLKLPDHANNSDSIPVSQVSTAWFSGN